MRVRLRRQPINHRRSHPGHERDGASGRRGTVHIHGVSFDGCSSHTTTVGPRWTRIPANRLGGSLHDCAQIVPEPPASVGDERHWNGHELVRHRRAPRGVRRSRRWRCWRRRLCTAQRRRIADVLDFAHRQVVRVCRERLVAGVDPAHRVRRIEAEPAAGSAAVVVYGVVRLSAACAPIP